MNSTNEVVPERFAPLVAAVEETLNGLTSHADRAEMLIVIARSYELWLKANVEELPRTELGTMATEHESAETLAKMFRDHWMAILSASGNHAL